MRCFRFLAVLVLIEYTALMPMYLYAFGMYRITPRSESAKLDEKSRVHTNFLTFLRDIFHLFDVLGYLRYREDIPSYQTVGSAELAARRTITPGNGSNSGENQADLPIEEQRRPQKV